MPLPSSEQRAAQQTVVAAGTENEKGWKEKREKGNRENCIIHGVELKMFLTFSPQCFFLFLPILCILNCDS